MAAALETLTTTDPGSIGSVRASRTKWKTWYASVFQFVENVSHVCSWSGPMTGFAPAFSTIVWGR